MEMKCAVFYDKEDLRIERKAIREPAPDECVIRVKSCGVCGTDIHAYLGHTSYMTRPLILGHEFSGEIVQVGKQVAGFNIGDRVTVEPNLECGKCTHCRDGKIRLCPNNRPYGTTLDGAFAEYMIAREDRIYLIPDSLSYDEAAFAEPVSNVVHGVDIAEIRPGQTVVVLGGGPAGLQFTQLAKAAGADPLILITRATWKASLAKELGADHVLSPRECDVHSEVMRITDELGAHVAIEAIGGAQALEQCFSLTRKGGRTISYGVPPESDHFSIPAFEFLTHGKQILSCWLNPFCFERAIDVLAKKVVKAEPLITHRFSLDEIQQAFETMIEKPHGFIKAVVTL
jgi:threonine dehydrogenase-like Zn-dependent dehydrogenase